MNKKIIATTNAPAAIGPYSQAVSVGNTVYISGQLPIDPQKGKFAGDDIKSQTKQSLTNIKNILLQAGLGMENIVKMTVLLKDINDFDNMNEVYKTFFEKDFPARAAFQVGKLPKDALVEIEAIAVTE